MGYLRQHSMLLSEGHPDASNYPLGKLEFEAALVVERQNNQLVSLVSLLDLMVSKQPNQAVKPQSSRSAARRFSGVMKTLMGK